MAACSNGVDEVLLDEFKRATARKLADVRCPYHRRPPQLQFAGSSLRDVTIRLSGCCQALMALANQAVASPKS